MKAKHRVIGFSVALLWVLLASLVLNTFVTLTPGCETLIVIAPAVLLGALIPLLLDRRSV